MTEEERKQAERDGAVKALLHAAKMFERGYDDDPTLEISYLRNFAQEVKNGRQP